MEQVSKTMAFHLSRLMPEILPCISLGCTFPRQSLLNRLHNLQNLNQEHYSKFLKFHDEEI